jgi:hypothetical protein
MKMCLLTREMMLLEPRVTLLLTVGFNTQLIDVMDKKESN